MECFTHTELASYVAVALVALAFGFIFGSR